jgi:curved DNA-binding protein CbpA
MAKDSYLILGVPLDAAPDRIRSAFRRLAPRYHPDRRGESSSGKFRNISEAYRVLSDPVRRARYDRELRGAGQPEPGASLIHDPEPLISEPVPVTGRHETVRPSYEALLARLAQTFAGVAPPKAERDEFVNYMSIYFLDFIGIYLDKK